MTANYATKVKNIYSQVQTLLQDASSSTYTHLGAIDNTNIMVGARRDLNAWKNSAIFIEVLNTEIVDATLGTGRNHLIVELSLVVVIKNYDESSAQTKIVDLVGDIVDVLMSPSNRELSNNCRLLTASPQEYGKYIEKSNILRWCDIKLTVDHNITFS